MCHQRYDLLAGLADDFLAAAFFVAVFLVAAFLVAVFLAAAFLADFLAPFLGAGPFAAFAASNGKASSSVIRLMSLPRGNVARNLLCST